MRAAGRVAMMVREPDLIYRGNPQLWQNSGHAPLSTVDQERLCPIANDSHIGRPTIRENMLAEFRQRVGRFFRWGKTRPAACHDQSHNYRTDPLATNHVGIPFVQLKLDGAGHSAATFFRSRPPPSNLTFPSPRLFTALRGVDGYSVSNTTQTDN